MAAQSDTLKLGILSREVPLNRSSLNKEKRTVTVQFSSEAPVERWFGTEILDHSGSSCDLSRMKSGAAVLMEHDTRMRCGITEDATITSEKRGEATVRFSKTPLGDQCMGEVEDGTLRYLSVGYRVNKFEVDENTDEHRAVSWEPMEVSFVGIPADPSCKVLRSDNSEEKEVTLMFKRNIQLDHQAPNPGGGAAVINEPKPQSDADAVREIMGAAIEAERNYDPEQVRAIANECANAKVPDVRGFYRRVFSLAKKPNQTPIPEGFLPLPSNDMSGRLGARGYQSIGERVVNSEAYRGAMKHQKGQRGFNLYDSEHYSFGNDRQMLQRTTFSASGQSISGTSGINIDQQPGINILNQQPLYVSDLFAQGTTSGDVVRYMIEDTYTNSATRVAEGSAKPESALDVSVVTVTVEKTATWLKMTEEMMEDFGQMQAYVNGRLAYMVQALEDQQLITGTGSSQIKGVLNWTGLQTHTGSVGTIDALLRAVEKVRGAGGVGFATPTAIIMHPADWLNVRLTKDANGQYLLGGPTFGAYGVGGFSNVAMAWGVPVVATTSITQGTALTGDFRMGAQIFRRKGLTIATTNSDNDDFQKNLITIRAEQRMALAVYQPNRFCSVTGIPATS